MTAAAQLMGLHGTALEAAALPRFDAWKRRRGLVFAEPSEEARLWEAYFAGFYSGARHSLEATAPFADEKVKVALCYLAAVAWAESQEEER